MDRKLSNGGPLVVELNLVKFHLIFSVYPGENVSNSSLVWKKADIFKIIGDDDEISRVMVK